MQLLRLSRQQPRVAPHHPLAGRDRRRDQGHHRAGPQAHPHGRRRGYPNSNSLDYVYEAIKTIYATRSGNGEIRRVNVNIAPLPVEDFRKLKACGIGTYQCFQETYHRETYAKVHPRRKSDYDWRATVMDRAMEAGIDDARQNISRLLNDYAPVCDRLAVLATKSLTGETLTENDAKWIENYGVTLAGFSFITAIPTRSRVMIFRW